MSLLRIPRYLELTGGSRSKLYADVAAGLMVKPVKLGPRMVAIPSEEADAIVAARTGGATDEQVRALVRNLHAKRAKAAQAVLQQVA